MSKGINHPPCPFCGGTDLDWESPYFLEDGAVCADMVCENCGKDWARIFEYTTDQETKTES